MRGSAFESPDSMDHENFKNFDSSSIPFDFRYLWGRLKILDFQEPYCLKSVWKWEGLRIHHLIKTGWSGSAGARKWKRYQREGSLFKSLLKIPFNCCSSLSDVWINQLTKNWIFRRFLDPWETLAFVVFRWSIVIVWLAKAIRSVLITQQC